MEVRNGTITEKMPVAILPQPVILHQVRTSAAALGLQGLVARLEHGAVVLPCICVRSMSQLYHSVCGGQLSCWGNMVSSGHHKGYLRETLRKRRGNHRELVHYLIITS